MFAISPTAITGASTIAATASVWVTVPVGIKNTLGAWRGNIPSTSICPGCEGSGTGPAVSFRNMSSCFCSRSITKVSSPSNISSQETKD